MRASVACGSAVAIWRCSTAYSLANVQASASSRQMRMPPRSLSAAAACSRWACGSAAEARLDGVGHRGGERIAPRQQRGRRVGAVLGLGQQVAASSRIGRVVGDDQALARPLQHVRATPCSAASSCATVTAGLPGPTTLRTRGIDAPQ